MCGRIGDYSEGEFLRTVQRMAEEQRRDDPGKSERPSGGYNERSDVGYRPTANLCFAYSLGDRAFYIGYSGGAGGMTSHQRVTNHAQAERRLQRLDDAGFLPRDDTRKLGRPRCNCAEASAYAVALSYNQTLGDLNFVAYEPQKGKGGSRVPKRKAPCENCKTWIGDAAGYYDGRNWQCGGGGCDSSGKRKHDDDSHDRHGGGGGGGKRQKA